MIKVLIALAGLTVTPLPMALLLKSIDRRSSLCQGYVSGVVFHLLIFALCIRRMAEKMTAPHMGAVKTLLVIILVEMTAFMIIVVFKCCKAKKWLGIRQLLHFHESAGEQWAKKRIFLLFFGGACVIWLLGAFSYLRYVPEGAVTMMADINRLDFFGITNSDPMTMMGYYLKKLCGISQADAVCIVIPLSFYAAFVVLMWEMADTLFKKDVIKRSLCFLAEGILTVTGDCLYSQPFIVLHGLCRMENVLLILCVPFTFIIGLRLILSEEKIINPENKEIFMPSGWFALLLCMISTCLWEKSAFALTGLNIIIYLLLFAGRRYLPWLQSSKS